LWVGTLNCLRMMGLLLVVGCCMLVSADIREGKGDR
jgi:hypothetical protein